YSIHQALGQLYLGAAGATRTQIGQLLRATGDDAADQAGWRALAAALRPRQGLESAFTLHSANGIFAQRGHPFRREYLRAVGAGEGGAEARELDYEGQPEAARVAINDWVSEQTTGTITGAVGPDVLTANTRLVLVNAVYFKAAWLDQFDEQATTAGTFTLHDGTEVTLPFMHARSELEYVETPEFQAVRLPYVGGQTSALVILPRPGAAETVESTFSALSLDEHLGAARERRVVLALPRFALRPALSLAENLRALGLTDAFVPGGADFTALDGTRDLYLTEALHQAYVKVNEQGTEAAAETSVSMGTFSLAPPPEPVVMTVDRPFLFLVRDDATGALLFMGRI
ncbi:MAG TPA: hypothetical protein DCZ72_07665, partial [Armatimonadetes bacterium]|nr:hypothetical protein [Armatimonadota bacterium]